ncbi:hypothetical protein IP88_06500 [alpha proteobacterium AAP81b]|nr:hypothetical protein IP88_06500 [alpha proteobacterium AAP81b]
MQYALLIYEDEATYADPAVMQDIIPKHMAFSQQIGDKMRGGAGLERSATATVVRTAGGTHSLHDGPFAEAREQLGGFYVVEAPDLDAAIAIAKAIPLAGDGAIEVRPVLGM